MDFMKKYIQFAKQQYQPVLSEAACELIGTYYTELRAGAAGNDRAIPVTARQLETLIRYVTSRAPRFEDEQTSTHRPVFSVDVDFVASIRLPPHVSLNYPVCISPAAMAYLSFSQARAV